MNEINEHAFDRKEEEEEEVLSYIIPLDGTKVFVY